MQSFKTLKMFCLGLLMLTLYYYIKLSVTMIAIKLQKLAILSIILGTENNQTAGNDL